MRRWTYDDANKADGFREEWRELRKWHVAYTDSSAVELGKVHSIGNDGLLFGGAPALSWKEMWALLDSRAPGASDGAEIEPSAATASFSALAASEPLRGNDLRERLAH
eukprot:5854175-Pleurochrysis_carterae.AAC.1